MRLLIVEDNDDLRVLFTRFLGGKGFQVHSSPGGREALDSLGEFEPEMVLTDVMMPGLDGIELIRLLRAIPALAGVAMVAMSADVSPENRRRALEAGASDFLAKPMRIHALVDKMEEWRRRTGEGPSSD